MNSINGATNGTSFEFSAKNLPKNPFINNEYIATKCDKTFSVYSPKDNSLVADNVPIVGQANVDTAVEAAEKALPQWRRFTAVARRDVLLLLKFTAPFGSAL